jgi:hypothetical protein
MARFDMTNRVRMLRSHSPSGFSPKPKTFTTSSVATIEPEEPSLTFLEASTTDTDGDGFSDLIEIEAGTNQNDPVSFPVSLFNVFNGV